MQNANGLRPAFVNYSLLVNTTSLWLLAPGSWFLRYVHVVNHTFSLNLVYEE